MFSAPREAPPKCGSILRAGANRDETTSNSAELRRVNSHAWVVGDLVGSPVNSIIEGKNISTRKRKSLFLVIR
jgi:hypothetical protein